MMVFLECRGYGICFIDITEETSVCGFAADGWNRGVSIVD